MAHELDQVDLMLEALDELRPYVSRNEYFTEATIRRNSIDEVEDIAQRYDFVYFDVDEYVEEEGVPYAEVTITIDLDEWHDDM